MLALLTMLGAMVSGIMLSREVLGFLSIRGGTAFARTLHMLCAYWGLIFMSIHLGLRWGMVVGVLRKRAGGGETSAVRTQILRILALTVSGFGVHAFFQNHISDYLFLRSHFVFFDWDQPLAGFLAESIPMMTLWACLGHY